MPTNREAFAESKSVHDSFLCRLIFFLRIYIELSLHYLEFNNHEL